MKQIALFPSAAPSTILGYGTTSLMRAQSSKERLALLGIAFDLGIRHFDTAPYYGYGEAERVLGDFIENKRDQLTITTKYGIQPAAVVKLRTVNLLARRVLRLFPFLREALSKRAQLLSQKCPFTAAAARRSLEQSLSALKTDRVDLFLLHEPTYADAASEEIHQFLQAELRLGRIRAFGCGGDFHVIEQIANAKLPTSKWLQFEDNILNRRIEKIRPNGAKCITYRTFHQALAALTGWLEAAPGRYGDWESQLQIDMRTEGTLASLLQAASHSRNPDGIVLFSSHRADRIRSAVRVASENRFSSQQLRKFDELTKHIGQTGNSH